MTAEAPAPQNLDAEEYVLGALLVPGCDVGAVLGTGLTPDEFYRHSHGRIFEALAELHGHGEPTDVISAKAALERRDCLKDVGGPERLQELAAIVPATRNAPHHATLVRQAASRRERYWAFREAAAIELNGGLEAHPAVRSRLMAALTEPGAGVEAGPSYVPLDDFLAEKVDVPPALLGTDDDALLPAGGLLILGGKSGKGKTTFAIEAALHLASGVDFLGMTVARALRVLIIENEGPREPFRRKLERKRESWQHEIVGEILVHVLNWGAVTFGDDAARRRLRADLERDAVDVVIGDPLGSLGVTGNGAPDETREFLPLLVDMGLTSRVAFWLLHHFRKEDADDELDMLSGAWAPHTDTVFVLKTLDGNRSRFSVPKHRWAHARPPAILSFDTETESFAYIGDEAGGDRDVAAEIEQLLADGKWRTSSEIAAKKDGGIGASREHVETELTVNERFVSVAGPVVGRSPRATVWQLASQAEQVEQVGSPGQGELDLPGPPCPPKGEGPEQVDDSHVHRSSAHVGQVAT